MFSDSIFVSPTFDVNTTTSDLVAPGFIASFVTQIAATGPGLSIRASVYIPFAMFIVELFVEDICISLDCMLTIFKYIAMFPMKHLLIKHVPSTARIINFSTPPSQIRILIYCICSVNRMIAVALIDSYVPAFILCGFRRLMRQFYFGFKYTLFPRFWPSHLFIKQLIAAIP